MTKEKYMALADLQTVWTNSMKPWIVATFIAAVAVEAGATPKLVLQDGSLLDQSTFQPAGDYITKVASEAANADNLVLAAGGNIPQSTFIPATEKGANNGVATLGADGKVPSSQLPAYVDDVLEFANLEAFPAEGEGGKIYVALDSNKTYRWGGSTYVEIATGLALGETQGTAYEGSKGKKNADDIATLTTNKADKDTDAVEGDFAKFDANGNPVDSGKKEADFATAAQGLKADSAIQGVQVNGVDLTKGADNKVNVEFEIPERVTAEELAAFVV
jgi:hypothetical protein